MAWPEPYRLADKTLALLNKSAVRLVDNAKRRLLIDGFDELNVIKQTDSLYDRLDENNRRRFKELFVARYLEIVRELQKGSKLKESEDSVDELAEMYIAGLLGEPNAVTKYVYDAEVLRKRDRAKEAILSVPTKAQKQLEIEKHVRYFQQMTGWYTDFASQGAEIQALEDSGVEKVERHEHNDKKTCEVCLDADGEIYPIDKIPEIPHLRCRRWFTPV